MKDIYAALLGVGGVALGAGVVCALTFDRVNGMDDKLTGISRGMRYIQDNVSMDIPEEVAKELYRNAAQDFAANAVKKASSDATKEISDSIKSQVKDVIKDAYKNVESDVKHQLESQINLQTIEKIQNQVSEKVAKQVIEKSLFNFTKDSSKEDVIKTCIENGMETWEIERILKSMN